VGSAITPKSSPARISSGVSESTGKHARQACKINQRLIFLLYRGLFRFNDVAQPVFLRPPRDKGRICGANVYKSRLAAVAHQRIGRRYGLEMMHDHIEIFAVPDRAFDDSSPPEYYLFGNNPLFSATLMFANPCA
jgi:hypothetical protein